MPESGCASVSRTLQQPGPNKLRCCSMESILQVKLVIVKIKLVRPDKKLRRVEARVGAAGRAGRVVEEVGLAVV
jgi:hypothetical protein